MKLKTHVGEDGHDGKELAYKKKRGMLDRKEHGRRKEYVSERG